MRRKRNDNSWVMAITMAVTGIMIAFIVAVGGKMTERKDILHEFDESEGLNLVGPSGVPVAIDLASGDVTIENCKRLYVGTGGDIKVEMAGQTVTFKNVIGGTYLYERIDKIYQTGTTASDIIAITWKD